MAYKTNKCPCLTCTDLEGDPKFNSSSSSINLDADARDGNTLLKVVLKDALPVISTSLQSLVNMQPLLHHRTSNVLINFRATTFAELRTSCRCGAVTLAESQVLCSCASPVGPS